MGERARAREFNEQIDRLLAGEPVEEAGAAAAVEGEALSVARQLCDWGGRLPPVPNDLRRRAYEHRTGRGGGFTSKYSVNKLVYYEIGHDARSAIAREKQIKGGSRQKKLDLVNGMNPEWKDLYDQL